MPSVNPGPATTQTASTELMIAPQQFPNFNSSGQGTNGYRCLAFAKSVPVSSTGDAAVAPLINTTFFDLLGSTTTGIGAIVFCNPLALVNGVLTATSIASTAIRLWSGPNQTGTALCAATTLGTLIAGANATGYVQPATATALGAYQVSQWGVGATNGTGGASSYNIFCNVTTASGVTASQVDIYVFGTDLSP